MRGGGGRGRVEVGGGDPPAWCNRGTAAAFWPSSFVVRTEGVSDNIVTMVIAAEDVRQTHIHDVSCVTNLVPAGCVLCS